jgi:hypothetical protein
MIFEQRARREFLARRPLRVAADNRLVGSSSPPSHASTPNTRAEFRVIVMSQIGAEAWD